MKVPKNSLSIWAVVIYLFFYFFYTAIHLSWLICSCFHSADCLPALHLALAHSLWPVTFLSLNCETHGNQNNAAKSQTVLVSLLSTGCSSQSVRKLVKSPYVRLSVKSLPQKTAPLMVTSALSSPTTVGDKLWKDQLYLVSIQVC